MVAAVLESLELIEAPDAKVTAAEVELSIVMPCLNEAKTVGVCVRKALTSLEKMGVNGEVIIADNGSSDGSVDIARAHGARVVHVARKGYGSALQGGIAAARGTYVIMGDADDSYDFTRLEGFLDRLRQGDDLVMGNRFKGGIHPGAMPWLHRYVGNPVLTGILNLFFRTPIGDAHCGLRGFRKDAYQRLDLTTPGMEFASEMVVKASLRKQKISEVATELRPDGRDRPPHLRSFRDGWRHLRFMLLHCPLWMFLIPALFLMTVGAGLMGFVPDLLAMICGAFAITAGYQGVWMWLFARVHGARNGQLPDESAARVVNRLTVDRCAIAGLVLAASGIGICVWQGWTGDPSLAGLLWGFVALSLGAQTIFGGFLLGVLGLFGSKPERETASG